MSKSKLSHLIGLILLFVIKAVKGYHWMANVAFYLKSQHLVFVLVEIHTLVHAHTHSVSIDILLEEMLALQSELEPAYSLFSFFGGHGFCQKL